MTYEIATDHVPPLRDLPDRYTVSTTMSSPATQDRTGVPPSLTMWRQAHGSRPASLAPSIRRPDAVRVERNHEAATLGGGRIDVHIYRRLFEEATTGSIPVSGGGYEGPFTGEGWNQIWFDMSEIVRPTRDGIHGREYIATDIELGRRPRSIQDMTAPGSDIRTVALPIPFVLDTVQEGLHAEATDTITDAAASLQTAVRTEAADGIRYSLPGQGTDSCPVIETPALDEPREDDSTVRVGRVRKDREEVYEALEAGRIDAVYLQADADGYSEDGTHLTDWLQRTHAGLRDRGLREEVSIIVSGDIRTAADAGKAIALGADGIVLTDPLLVALEAEFEDEGVAIDARRCNGEGVQRIRNMVAAWRKQLIEVLGAVGIRELRRLRGEHGRIMRAEELRQEAFGDIDGV